uniref:Dirigent protein n=3 Tax=Triticum urartu TaxID=4572 RepID=A0A8R7Q3Y5_TRIUA
MDDFYTGPNPTALRVVSGRSLSPDNGTATSPRQFGDIVALNDPLTEGPDRGSARVGTAQGFAVRVSEGGVVSDLNLHLFLEAGEYSGSSVVVNGRVDLDSATRESVVVGGTGRFRFARGYMLSRDYEYDLANGGVVELDVYVQVQ